MPRGRADYLALGDWNARCSICGAKYKASQLKKHWQGLWRCSRCWEPRQAQDFVRAVADTQAPPWVQIPGDVFVQLCNTKNGIAGIGIAGCLLPGRAF